MLGQRRRRCAALKQRWLHVIVQRYACLLGRPVPEAYTQQQQLTQGKTLNQCWFNVCPPSTTFDQC